MYSYQQICVLFLINIFVLGGCTPIGERRYRDASIYDSARYRATEINYKMKGDSGTNIRFRYTATDNLHTDQYLGSGYVDIKDTSIYAPASLTNDASLKYWSLAFGHEGWATMSSTDKPRYGFLFYAGLQKTIIDSTIKVDKQIFVINDKVAELYGQVGFMVSPRPDYELGITSALTFGEYLDMMSETDLFVKYHISRHFDLYVAYRDLSYSYQNLGNDSSLDLNSRSPVISLNVNF